jgi:hypothetical protein
MALTIAIGTIKLPQRQINASSYTKKKEEEEERRKKNHNTAFNRRVLYCAWDNLKDAKVLFAGINKLEKAGITLTRNSFGQIRSAPCTIGLDAERADGCDGRGWRMILLCRSKASARRRCITF